MQLPAKSAKCPKMQKKMQVKCVCIFSPALAFAHLPATRTPNSLFFFAAWSIGVVVDVDEAAEWAQTGFGRPDLARPDRSTARPSRKSTGPARGGQGFYKGALPWSSVVADVGLPPEWLATIVATSTVRTAVVSQKNVKAKD